MVQSAAKTVDAYLAELPEDRRAVVSTVRDVILANLPKGYVESVSMGMISYSIPLERFPKTYNKQPLCYVSLAAQKNHYAIYLMGVYMRPKRESTLREAFAKAGKKLDIGKSCVRFKKLDDLPLDVIGDEVASVTLETYLATYEKIRAMSREEQAKICNESRE
jgi:hypothetical protein